MFDGLCRETVTILEAIIFGAGDACIEISTFSLVTFAVVLIVAVPAAKYAIFGLGILIRMGLERLRTRNRTDTDSASVQDGLTVDDGPIRSTGAWGRTKR